MVFWMLKKMFIKVLMWIDGEMIWTGLFMGLKVDYEDVKHGLTLWWWLFVVDNCLMMNWTCLDANWCKLWYLGAIDLELC